MSHSTTLYCPETKQAVHVAEQSSSWFRGPDYAVIVGAFCLAHVGRDLESTQAFSEMDDFSDYVVWTADNAQAAYTALVGGPLAHLSDRLTPPYL